MLFPFLLVFGACKPKAPVKPPSPPSTAAAAITSPFDGDIQMELSVSYNGFTEAALICQGIRDQRPIENNKVTFYKVPNSSCLLKLLPMSIVVNVQAVPKLSCDLKDKKLICQ